MGKPMRAKRREMRKDFHRSFWYTEGRGEMCFSFRLHLARLSTFLFPLPFSPLPERMGCCTASCAGQLSRDAGTEHCSWLLTRNGEVSDNGVQNKTCVLCFLKHSIS